ncbi:hypothetical protein LSAT2_026409, partial [Lamellibrachia satsuma]
PLVILPLVKEVNEHRNRRVDLDAGEEILPPNKTIRSIWTTNLGSRTRERSWVQITNNRVATSTAGQGRA